VLVPLPSHFFLLSRRAKPSVPCPAAGARICPIIAPSRDATFAEPAQPVRLATKASATAGYWSPDPMTGA